MSYSMPPPPPPGAGQQPQQQRTMNSGFPPPPPPPPGGGGGVGMMMPPPPPGAAVSHPPQMTIAAGLGGMPLPPPPPGHARQQQMMMSSPPPVVAGAAGGGGGMGRSSGGGAGGMGMPPPPAVGAGATPAIGPPSGGGGGFAAPRVGMGISPQFSPSGVQQQQQQPTMMIPPPGQNPQSGGANTSLNQAMGNMNLGGVPPMGAPKQFGAFGGGGGPTTAQTSNTPFQQQQQPMASPMGAVVAPPGQQQQQQQQLQQPRMFVPGAGTAASTRPPPAAPGVGFNPAATSSVGPGQGFHPQQQQPSMSQGMMQHPQPGAGGMPMPPGIGGPQPSMEIFQENIDHSIQVPKRILQLTSSYIPASANLAHVTKVPLGAVIRPLAPCKADEEDVKVVQPGAAGIVRCKRCRTYINAFVTFLENGRRWRCNICSQLNEVPAPYFCHLDEEGRRRDRDSRPELSEGVMEFVAPSEYMVRPPQPPSYFFVIDVSATSVRNGMLHSVAKAISASLDSMPGSPRTQVGFITYDDSVHYYSLKSGLSNPQMLVVADLVELFVPVPDDLLVNLQESREVIDAFLQNLPIMFQKTTCQNSCLGPALKAAFTVTKHIGGKMCVFQSILPTLGDGTLVPRENIQIMGTPDEIKLLRPAQNWYKETAVEFSRAQICVDMFLFPHSYIDVASLAELPKVTAGTLHTYPGFNYDVDGPRFESELCRVLTQHTAFEAVMRIRCTRGMKITNFYGNFFIRGSDLLALPTCTSDSVFAFDLAHDEQNVSSSVVTVQSALLYTSTEGERRIRVVTQAIPVSSLASEVIGSVDADAVAALLAKQALDVSIKTNLDNARNKMQQVCIELIRASKEGDKPRTVSGYSAPPPHMQQQQHPGSESENKPIPVNLKLLPLYTLGLMKNVAFRGGTDVHPDERIHAMNLLASMGVTETKHFIYPRMFSLHDMSPSAGLPSSDAPIESVCGQDRIMLPRVLNLTVDRLSSNGIFLLDNGVDMFLWVGRSSDPAMLNSLFGMNSLEGVNMSQVRLQTIGNDFASRLNAIVLALREDDTQQTLHAKVTIVREGDHGLESRFFWHLIEDSASFSGGTFSYEDFMQFVHSGGQGGPPVGPPGAPLMPRQGGPPGMPPPPGQTQGPPRQSNQVPMPPIGQPKMTQGPPQINQGPPALHSMNQAPPAPHSMNQGPPAPPPVNQGPPIMANQQMQGPPLPAPTLRVPPSGGMPGRPMPSPHVPTQGFNHPPAPSSSGGMAPPHFQQQYSSGPSSGPLNRGSMPPPPAPPQHGRGPPPPPPPPPQYR